MYIVGTHRYVMGVSADWLSYCLRSESCALMERVIFLNYSLTNYGELFYMSFSHKLLSFYINLEINHCFID